jgi:hypothetical protein
MTSQQPAEQLKTIAGIFADQSSAEAAKQALQQAGFAANRVATEEQAIDPNPSVQDSRAREGARGGAIVGALFGAIVTFLLTRVGISLPGNSPIAVTDPDQPAFIVLLLGIVAGSAAGALLGALSGVNAPKRAGTTSAELARKYLVKVEGSGDELDRAKDILRQQGSEIS